MLLTLRKGDPMIYQCTNGLVEISEKEAELLHKDKILIFNDEEWENLALFHQLDVTKLRNENIRYCKAESYDDFLYGTFSIPQVDKLAEPINFIYVIHKEGIIFIDNSNFVSKQLSKMVNKHYKLQSSIGLFFYHFIELLLENDAVYLDDLENDIETLEDGVLLGTLVNFNHRLIAIRKEVLAFYRYYEQLLDMCDVLLDNRNGYFQKSVLSRYQLLVGKITRLQTETQLLREYMMQTREVYQAQIDINQNNIMKTLTIVTIIFLPLTLLVGWYGMNFTYMPELSLKYGYLGVILGSILIILFCLWYFKKKKFW